MRPYVLPVVTVVTMLVAGCKKEDPPGVAAREAERKVAEAAGAAADRAKQERDDYVARAQKAVDEAGVQIDELKAKAKKASARARRDAQADVEAMEARWRVAERKLGELRSASGEAWKDLRSGVDKAVEDLKQPHRKARSRPPANGR